MRHDLNGGVWPLPSLLDYGDPVISDGFGRLKRRLKGHWGVDIMYRRKSRGPFARPDFTRWFACPEGTTVHACHAGRVHAVKKRPNGYTIEIDHAYPYMSVYRHVFEPAVDDGWLVRAGEPIGLVGYDPRNPRAIRHLHFEIWDYRRGIKYKRRCVDPAPFLRSWRYLR